MKQHTKHKLKHYFPQKPQTRTCLITLTTANGINANWNVTVISVNQGQQYGGLTKTRQEASKIHYIKYFESELVTATQKGYETHRPGDPKPKFLYPR